MNMTLQRSFLTLTALALLSAATHAQTSATGTLKGVVTDPEGAVIGGALVRIVHWGLDDKRKTVETETAIHTDANGQFRFELAPGIYDIFISAVAFSPVTKQVNVGAGKETVFNARLKLSRFFKPLL